MNHLALIVMAALTLFVVYSFVVLRIRGKQERRKERQLGLDPLRR